MKMPYRTCYYTFNGLFMAAHYTHVWFMALMNGLLSDDKR